MAKSSTTHVIEIETGIGEPAFIPLTLGTETQPISVGRKGMWRIESARVLDIHAFVYFDGSALFMQSADEEAAAATVDGYKIGKAWTELRAPCTIEIGAARLRFRSLLPPTESEDPVTAAIPVGHIRAELQATGPNLPPPRPPPPSSQSAPTMAQDNDEPTPITRHQQSQQPQQEESPKSQRPKAPPPPPISSAPAKPERPFRPGAFSVADQDESTRFKPLETSGQNPAMSTGPQPSRPADAPMPMGHGAMQPASMPPMMPGSMPPSMGPVPSGTFQMHGQMQTSGGVAPSTMTGPMPMPNAYASGGYPASGPPPNGYPLPPSGYPQPPPPAHPFAAFVETFKQWNPVKKAAMILLPIALVLGIVSLFDNDAPAPQTRGPAANASAKVTTQELPAWPPGVPCPPPNWPAHTPLPCKPNGVPVVPNPTTFEASNPSPRDAGAVPQGKTSLQRQAVDAMTQGDLPRAAALYDELARREPGVTVYAESARILRAKLDAGN